MIRRSYTNVGNGYTIFMGRKSNLAAIKFELRQ